MHIDSVLAHVIRASKSDAPPFTFHELREILKLYYSKKMTMQDVIEVLCELHELAKLDARLKIPAGTKETSKLLLAPISIAMSDSVNKGSHLSLSTSMSLEDFYNNFIYYIISQFRFCHRGGIPELADCYLPEKI